MQRRATAWPASPPRAAQAGWPEVVRAGFLGQAVDAWFRQEPSLGAALDELIYHRPGPR